MKAILGNFKKISETEFSLNKDLQFAQVQVDDSGIIKSVNYQDKQNIEIGDILTHLDLDYEVTDIDTSEFDRLVVNVKRIVQEQDVPDRSKFVARKMSPRKPKSTMPPPRKSNVTVDQITEIENKLQKLESVVTIQPKPMVTDSISNKRSIFKRLASWISSKLSSYSNS
tara:strand:+ start:1056 stop:1562 length:507 start_codon:yes stop_codon:yes gene_type:complete